MALKGSSNMLQALPLLALLAFGAKFRFGLLQKSNNLHKRAIARLDSWTA